ncbi:MAG TPA: class I SAM-dependent rRNA methyltransferase [Candidatus Eisenbacteria bacterium]|jgi:23S rRNA (cytosine1962-C5)-methyltransferase|nr:class I SAM-dependent rRNA methyltransferase [Candidatus Eisenbacteria bacterium]
MARIILAKNQDRRLRSGHLWVFSNEIASIEGSPEPGGEVLVEDFRGGTVGTGLYNPHSLIAVRLFARRARAIDDALLRERLEQAKALRERILPVESTYRLVYSEGDFLPGLIVDRYGDHLGVQSLTLGVERRLDAILDLLMDVMKPAGICCRRDAPTRALEGLPMLEPLERGTVPDRIDAPYEGYVIEVDLRGGQKTGEFLDMRDNRKRVAQEARGRRVLDLYCYTGLFSLHCAAAGAVEVVGVDRSGAAIERARRNLARNAPGKSVTFVEEEAETALTRFTGEGAQFDMIVLDPPSLVKSRKAFKEGAAKYEKLNATAMRLLPPGGVLATASCSHHVDAPVFLDILRSAAKRAGAAFRMVDVRGQSRDHPVLLAARETSYLTLALLERIH